nr:MAG TPA: hypothetical protein [Caudoviricetes sp.]
MPLYTLYRNCQPQKVTFLLCGVIYYLLCR